jgi:hypothetical protein
VFSKVFQFFNLQAVMARQQFFLLGIKHELFGPALPSSMLLCQAYLDDSCQNNRANQMTDDPLLYRSTSVKNCKHFGKFKMSVLEDGTP